MSSKAKKVVALKEGTVYDSVSDAAKAVGCSKGAIYTAISKGVKVKGIQWAWADGKAPVKRKKISLGDIPSEEEQRMLLHYFLRIRARARRCYRKHHGHLGKQTISETCYNLSRQIHYILDGKKVNFTDMVWGGFLGSLARSREDMILTGGNESVVDAISVFTYVKEHGDKAAKQRASEYMDALLYADEQIQLIKANRPYHRPDAGFAAELEIVYGIRYAPKDVGFTWNALKRLEDEFEKKVERIAALEKETRSLRFELQERIKREKEILSSIIQIAEDERWALREAPRISGN